VPGFTIPSSAEASPLVSDVENERLAWTDEENDEMGDEEEVERDNDSQDEDDESGNTVRYPMRLEEDSDSAADADLSSDEGSDVE
jgi:hypothetical protein